jgi:release factor glutamine methyltransferase
VSVPPSVSGNPAQSNQDFVNRLTPVWGKDEAEAILRQLWEDFFGPGGMPIPFGPATWPVNQAEMLEPLLRRLENKEPLQYVLGKAWFGDIELKVNASVLIPRPETEELVHWVLETNDQKDKTLLDLCTGSGCIALLLRKKGNWESVAGLDVSVDALQVAMENGENLGLKVDWQEADLLQTDPGISDEWDVWVSNPPYVLASEKAAMDPNVLDFEPHLALFVEDTDAVLFYRRILELGCRHLKPGGAVYFELNPMTVSDVAQEFFRLGYVNVEIRKDMFGKERMMRGFRPLA